MSDKKRIERLYGKMSNIVNRKIRGTSVTVGIVLILVASLVSAAVFIVYEYPNSTTGSAAQIYLEKGPNYANANALRLFYTGSATAIASGTTLDVNTTAGSYDVFLLNVLKVVNTSAGVTGPLFLYINGTLPTGVTLYYDNATEMTFSGTDTGTYSVVQGTGAGNGSLSGGVSPFSAKIPLTGSRTLYISFELTGTASGSGTLYFQVSIT